MERTIKTHDVVDSGNNSQKEKTTPFDSNSEIRIENRVKELQEKRNE